MKAPEIKGKLVPFDRSSAYLLKKAMDNRKGKSYLEAVSLYRRAYELEPKPGTLVALSQVYRDMGCYRLSNRELYRSLASDDRGSEAFYGLAVNHYFLLNHEAVLDSAAAYLTREPDGAYAFEAQDLVDWAFSAAAQGMKRRALPLKKLALKDETKGRHDRAVKRLKRAAQLFGADAGALCDLAMFLYKTGESREGLKLAARAMKDCPNQARPVCAAAMGLYALYGLRPSRALFARVLHCPREMKDDAVVFKTALALNAHQEGIAWLEKALGEERFDPDNLKRLAYLKTLTGDREKARQLYNRCLAVDARDIEAREALALMDENSLPLPEPGMIRQREACERFESFAALLSGVKRPVSAGDKRVLDWLMSVAWGKLADAVLGCVAERAPAQAERWMRMWLMDENVTEEARRRAAFRLGEMRPGKTYLMLSDGRLTYTRLKPVGEIKKNGRALFIKRFLLESRETGRVNEAAAFAIRHFDALPQKEKERAAGQDAYAYTAALKILFLRSLKKEKQVETYINDLMISLRRVERAMNMFLNGERKASHEAD